VFCFPCKNEHPSKKQISQFKCILKKQKQKMFLPHRNQKKASTCHTIKTCRNKLFFFLMIQKKKTISHNKIRNATCQRNKNVLPDFFRIFVFCFYRVKKTKIEKPQNIKKQKPKPKQQPPRCFLHFLSFQFFFLFIFAIFPSICIFIFSFFISNLCQSDC